MKQKVVIKVSLNGTKSRSKALKIAVSVSGVESAALGAQDKSQIEVVGDVDAVELTTQLRKNVGHAELVSVTAAGEKKEEVKVQQLAWPYVGGVPHPYMYELRHPVDYYQDPPCSIM